jgi:TonB family protein
VGDRVKISSDRVGKIGDRFADAGAPDVYDPPEKGRGKNSAAADVWSLGVTLTEVLTRQVPQVNGKDHGEIKLPEGLSSPFLDIARNCLWRDPEQRWSIGEIASRLGDDAGQPVKKPVVAQAVAVPAAVVAEALPKVEQATKPQSSRMWIGIGLVIAAILGGLLVMRHGSQSAQEAPAATSQITETKPEAPVTPPPVAQKPVEAPAAKPASGEDIVERSIPSIPKSARDTITGKVKVRVRVDVDSSGKVVGSKFEARGPSEYFAHQAKQAAERWKFAPATDEQRRWDLLFEFTRGGTQVAPSRVRGR